MNQLINRLKQEAGIDDNPDQEGLDLFAKLIVEECAMLARVGSAPVIAQVIEEHFDDKNNARR